MPVMFMKLSQNQVGESDLVYTAVSAENVSVTGDEYMYSYTSQRSKPDQSVFIPLVNCTEMEQAIKKSSDFEGVTARWFGVADFANTTQTTLKASGVFMVLDTEKEVKIGLGRDFTKTLLGPNQAFVTTTTLKYLGIEPNGRNQIQLVIDLRNYLNLALGTNKVLTEDDLKKLSDRFGFNYDPSQTYTFRGSDFFNSADLSDRSGIDLSFIDTISTTFTQGQVSNFIITNQEQLFIIRQDYSVIEGFESPNGKFPNSFGNVMVIDSKYILSALLKSVQTNFQSINNGNIYFQAVQTLLGDTSSIADLDINSYALEVDTVLKNREKYYLGTPDDTNSKLLTVQTNLGLRMLVQSRAPVAEAIVGFYYMRLFLQSIFATMVFFMVLLSVMLIYSLMISDVDEKQYEMGMLRALGLRSISIMQ
mmetsp:Transcript_2094/g.2662  ORF Transcript_2094/g.2662 Transcript_2094/m.2662 type:complete len:420 (-) Transcript_2094:15-1274(-)